MMDDLENKSSEAATSEWEKMLEENSDSNQNFSQNDIDSLFASAVKEGGDQKIKGVELLVDKNLQSYIRLPILEIIYDRFVRINSNSLRGYTSDTVDVDIENIKSQRFGEYMNRVPIPCMLSIFKALEWDNFGMIVIDSQMIYAFVEVLFGGRKTPPTLKVEGRPFTSIENSIVKSLTEVILSDLKSAFDAVTPVNFQLDRIETNPRFAMIVRPEDVVISLHLEITMDARSGGIDIIFPYSTIEPVKKILSRSYIGEKGGKDPNWMRHFENEINKAKVKVDVVLNSMVKNLKAIAELQVGKTIILDKLADTEWDLKVNKVKVSTGRPGKINDKLAVKLSEIVNVARYKD
jgi:flagellar motor switch protein FliM